MELSKEAKETLKLIDDLVALFIDDLVRGAKQLKVGLKKKFKFTMDIPSLTRFGLVFELMSIAQLLILNGLHLTFQ